MDHSLPGSSVHGILQAWILKWVAISFSRRSSQLRNRTRVSCVAGRFFTNWATMKLTYCLSNPRNKSLQSTTWRVCGWHRVVRNKQTWDNLSEPVQSSALKSVTGIAQTHALAPLQAPAVSMAGTVFPWISSFWVQCSGPYSHTTSWMLTKTLSLTEQPGSFRATVPSLLQPAESSFSKESIKSVNQDFFFLF